MADVINHDPQNTCRRPGSDPRQPVPAKAGCNLARDIWGSVGPLLQVKATYDEVRATALPICLEARVALHSGRTSPTGATS